MTDELDHEPLAEARALAPRAWRLEAAGAGKLVADRRRLTQAVMNPVQNAVQHTAEGDEIALGTALGDGRVRLWVRGVGATFTLDLPQGPPQEDTP